MTTATPSPHALPEIRLSRGFRPSAWLTLFWVSFQQLARGRRLLSLAALFALPALLAWVIRTNVPRDEIHNPGNIEKVLVFYMIPQALVPLTALILATGMVRDEVEGQTITYLLIRPLPRWSIYAAKLLAAWCVGASLAAVFDTATLAATHWGEPDLWGPVLPTRAAQVAGLSALSMFVYVALFGAVGLVVRWVLPLGVAYIVLIEGAFANIDFALRRVTVLWYVRVLAERWLGLHVDSWSIKLDESPSGPEALLTLLAAALVLSVGAAWLFGRREIRVKTPEGA